MKTVIAAFRGRADADNAIRELSLLDLEDSNIQILESGDTNPYPKLVARRVPEDRATLYAEVARRGAPVVIIEVEDRLADSVAQLLDEHGSLDLDSAARRWRTSGWEGYRESAQPFEESEARRERMELERESMAVIQEVVNVGNREVEQGGMRLRSFITETPVPENIELREEHVEVKREAVAEPLPSSADDSTFTEEEHVVTATTEEPVIEKRVRVVERVQVEKTADTRTETIEETERRRDVEVEPLEPGSPRR